MELVVKHIVVIANIMHMFIKVDSVIKHTKIKPKELIGIAEVVQVCIRFVSKPKFFIKNFIKQIKAMQSTIVTKIKLVELFGIC